MREFFANSQLLRFVAIAKQPVMPDFHKPIRQNMDQKPADKLRRGNSHQFPPAAVPVIPPLEGDHAVFHADDTVIRNGDAMGISAEIFHYAGGAFERRLTVNDPFLFVQRS